MHTTIPYTEDIKEEITETKRLLRVLNTDHDPLPFPDMLVGPKGQSRSDKHAKNVIATPFSEKTPINRLRELNGQLRMTVLKNQCMYPEFRKSSEFSWREDTIVLMLALHHFSVSNVSKIKSIGSNAESKKNWY